MVRIHLKKLICMSLLALGLTSTSDAVAASYESCEMIYELKCNGIDYAGGRGQIQCLNARGEQEKKFVTFGLLGGSLKGSPCEARGYVEVQGRDFDFEDFMTSFVQNNVGALLITGGSATVSTPKTSLRINASAMEYSGVCLGLGSLQGLILNEVERK